MKHKELVDFFLDEATYACGMIEKKNKDYAKDDDALFNFKVVSEINKLLGLTYQTPQEVCLCYAIWKIARIANLIKDNKTPKNEPLVDSLRDCANYLHLAIACIFDDKSQQTKTKVANTVTTTKRPKEIFINGQICGQEVNVAYNNDIGFNPS